MHEIGSWYILFYFHQTLKCLARNHHNISTKIFNTWLSSNPTHLHPSDYPHIKQRYCIDFHIPPWWPPYTASPSLHVWLLEFKYLSHVMQIVRQPFSYSLSSLCPLPLLQKTEPLTQKIQSNYSFFQLHYHCVFFTLSESWPLVMKCQNPSLYVMSLSR